MNWGNLGYIRAKAVYPTLLVFSTGISSVLCHAFLIMRIWLL